MARWRTEPHFDRSTLDATEWLMVFHPERLPAWLARHAFGLERAARRNIEQRRGMSVEQWRKRMDMEWGARAGSASSPSTPRSPQRHT